MLRLSMSYYKPGPTFSPLTKRTEQFFTGQPCRTTKTSSMYVISHIFTHLSKIQEYRYTDQYTFPILLHIIIICGIFKPLHRGAFCQFPFRWIHYCGSIKSTRKETGKMHLCALQRIEKKGGWKCHSLKIRQIHDLGQSKSGQSTKCRFSQERYVEDTLSPFKSNIGNVYCPLDVLGFLTIVFIRSVGSTSGGRGGGAQCYVTKWS